FPLDLTIRAENRIFVRGRGVDAELGGQLALGGTTANVIPSGQFDLIRGRINILGKRLVLEEGSVTLQGDFDPRLRLVARTDAGDVTVLIVVEGQATEPNIAFRSEPQLPEDEVLARLLFGKSIENISPLQAAQLASAVATLAGRGGDGIVSRLRQSTGLDDLDVTTDAAGNVGLRAGKYVSENVYTNVEIDSAGEAQINLNLDVTDSITVRGGAANTGETTLGIFFERDY
ncbi:translocation/assembly module TamB domain-containing protein, partial [Palleronia rufa]